MADIAEQMKREINTGDMATISDEAGAAPDKTLPVLYCGEVIDKPSVRSVIQKAAAKLK